MGCSIQPSCTYSTCTAYMRMTQLCCAPSVAKAAAELQTALQSLESALHNLKLLLNAQKTKHMLFSRGRTQPEILIQSSMGKPIEKVSSYIPEYLFR